MATGRPAHSYNSIAIHPNIGAFKLKLGKLLSRPHKSIARISYGPFSKIDLRTEPIVNTDWKKSSLEQCLNVLYMDVFARKQNVPTTMEKKSW
jgi:hypothetical protein